MAENGDEQLIRAESSPGEAYFILSQIDGNAITLTVTDGSDAWIGMVGETLLKNGSKKVSMLYEDYLSDTKKAFSGDSKFHFEFGKQENKLKVSWKKHVPTDDLKIQFGVALLKQHPAASSVICDMFMSTITSIGHKEQKILNVMKEKEIIEKENKKAKELIEKFAKAKEDTEKDLYSKFVLLLNEKKAKIRELEDETSVGHTRAKTQELEDETSVKHTNSKPIPSTSSSPTKHKSSEPTVEEESSLEHSMEDDTLDEGIRRPAPKKKKIC